MKTQKRTLLFTSSFLLVAPAVIAQAVYSTDFTGPLKNDATPSASGIFELGFDGGANGSFPYELGTWGYVGNGGIDDPATGDGSGTSQGNEIDSIGVARAQSIAGTNARAAAVIIDGSGFTAGTEYVITFDVIGGLNRDGTAPAETSGRFWVAEVGGVDATSGIAMDVSYNGWGAQNRPFFTQGTGSAFVNYLTPDDTATENGTNLVGEELPGTTTQNSFTFTYTAGTDIAFAVGTYNNYFAIDNFQIAPAGPGPTTWGGYDIGADSWVDTGGWLGWVNVDADPWVWVINLTTFVYLPESYVEDLGAWMYIQ
jgi:hypothetical protein